MTEELDPDAIIAEGVKVAARQERTRNLILGVMLLLVGVVFTGIGIYGMTTPVFLESSALVFGALGVGLSALLTGGIQLARGLRSS